MKVLARLAASFSCAIVAGVGLASPAGAEFVGTYEFAMGGDTATWTVVPCGHEAPNPCVYVVQNGGDMEPWSADAQLYVGYWTIRVERPDTIVCDDGEKHPARTTYSWDAVTNEGWVSARDNGVCDGEPQSLAAPFTLTKVGAAEVGPAAPDLAPADPTPAEAPTDLADPAPAEDAPAEDAGPPLAAEA